MQEDLFDKDMGLDLLMNPKKMSGDNISVISSQNDDASSVKSFDNIVGARERRVSRSSRSETTESEISIGEESFSEVASERSYVSKKSSSSSRTSSSIVHRKPKEIGRAHV